MDRTKKEKIERLAKESPVEGERLAAAAAMQRLRLNRKPMPPRGTPEWGVWCDEEKLRLGRLSKWLYTRLSIPELRDSLSVAEQKKVRNMARFGLSPPVRESIMTEIESMADRLGWSEHV